MQRHGAFCSVPSILEYLCLRPNQALKTEGMKPMRKLAIATASAMLGIALSLSAAVPAAHAAGKVDCDAVMQALGQGKKAKEVASDMKISVASVYRCKRHAKQAAKAETATQKMSERAAEAGAASAAPSPSTK